MLDSQPQPSWALLAVGLIVFLSLLAGSHADHSHASSGPLPPMRSVQLGFSSEAQPGTHLKPGAPLLPGHDYYFSVEIGAGHAGQSRLTVALFGFPGEMRLFPGADVGEVDLQADGSTSVARHGSVPLGVAPDSPTLRRRVFFRVATPDQPGQARLRCNVYHAQTLVQSWLVSARVGQRATLAQRLLSLARVQQHKPALDYVLSRTLDPAALAALGPQRLSILVNDGPAGTHNLRFLGGDGEVPFKHDASIDALLLQGLVKDTRSALRRASWGSPDSWESEAYLYATPGDRARLRDDLVSLACNGYRIYYQVIESFCGDLGQTRRLAALMRRPGQLQIALTRAAHLVLPAGLIYDYDCDTGAPHDRYQLCPAFLAALAGPDPLETSACFQGACPSRDDPNAVIIICPSGFWGYRHALGLPLSTTWAPDAPAALTMDGGPRVAVSVSTDPTLTLRQAHEAVLRRLRPDLNWSYADSRDATFQILRQAGTHLVYFYCHGGMAGPNNAVPYLQVGPLGGQAITPDNLFAKHIRWDAPRPLVFINGCQTTAVEPEHALNFVDAFVARAAASGVIGTEITIFEPLARTFAEECLRRFFEGEPIGEAMRQARLALLKSGNPLGLVYIPFVLPGLHLESQTPAAGVRCAQADAVLESL